MHSSLGRKNTEKEFTYFDRASYTRSSDVTSNFKIVNKKLCKIV